METATPTKNNSRTIIIIILLIIAAGVIYTITQNRSAEPEQTAVSEQEPVIEEYAEPYINEYVEETEASEPSGAEVTNKTAGLYIPYTENAQVAQAAQEGSAILFFHARWCPTCRSLDADIQKNAQSIPPNTTLFKVEYDAHDDLKKKYGVTYQHTLVQVDENLSAIHTWAGSRGLGDILAQIR